MLAGTRQINDLALEKRYRTLIKTIAKNIRKIKVERDLTHEKMAEATDLNLRLYMKIVTGEHGINLVTLIKLADGLGVSLSELLGE